MTLRKGYLVFLFSDVENMDLHVHLRSTGMHSTAFANGLRGVSSPIPFIKVHGVSVSINTCEYGDGTARATQPSQGIGQASLHHTTTVHTHLWDHHTSKKITTRTKTLNLAYECMQFRQGCQGAPVEGSTGPGMILRVRFIGLQ